MKKNEVSALLKFYTEIWVNIFFTWKLIWKIPFLIFLNKILDEIYFNEILMLEMLENVGISDIWKKNSLELD